ncbi:FG-GAP repeat domain-containing protein [Paenibacillus kobensis]|uniref:FG-GAP repeat domain-containing protein n=1 Tax=Paenibacillus kobensis TaxID=59841 RepID=UPI000FDA9A17|nr:VCBS repeat-containing protein [Paenibacillus kobensis]
MLRSTKITIVLFCIVISVLTACGARESDSGRSGRATSNGAVQEQQKDSGSISDNPELESAEASSEAESEAEPKSAAAHYQFPQEVALPFQAVEWNKLVQMEPKQTWKFVRTLSFGTLDGNPVSLAVYKEMDPDQLCGLDYESAALLEYRNKTYYYNDCFSMSLETEESPLLELSLVKLGYENKDGDSRRIVHGAAELFGNGPGRMLYLVYDRDEDQWYGFDNWGSPSVVDLDGDGTMELVNQFQGLHMQFPDIDIYRWNGPELEQSLSLKSTLKLPFVGQSVAGMDEVTHRFQISALTSLEEDAWDHPLEASYNYNAGRIVRSEAGGG